MPEPLRQPSPSLPVGRVHANAQLLRVLQPVALDDPWTLLPQLEHSGERLMAWSDPRGDRSFVALGLAHDAQLDGQDRFAQAAVVVETLQRSLTSLPSSPSPEPKLPLVLGGFAFSAAPRAERWAAWGDGTLWCPQLLVHRSKGATWAALTVHAQPGDTERATQRALDTLRVRLEHLLAGARGRTNPAICDAQPLPSTEQEQQEWVAQVNAARAEMGAGRIAKVVLARPERCAGPPGHLFAPLATAARLRDTQDHSVSFVVRRENGEAFVGATPEELVRLEGDRLRTVAMAGTRAHTGDLLDEGGQELLASEKDRHEQQLVVADIREALGPVVTELHVPEQPELARFGVVQHLRTHISARLREGVSLIELLHRMHPTSAVGGLPREPALRWLSEHEGMDRGWYAGPLGWVSADGDGVFVVSIRSALLQGSTATAFAGCGLVPRSDAQLEWNETLQKLRVARAGLALIPETHAQGS